MKNLLITCVAFVGFVFPSVAQVSHDYNPNDREPSVTVSIPKDKIPASVQASFNTQFNLNDPLTWSKFPYAIKEYGWVYDVGASDMQLNRYLVQAKTENGGILEAVYTPNGELVESRQVSKDIAVPPSVLEAFSKSQYKDWKIVGNKEIIRYYHDHNVSTVEQHFRLTVEKDGVQRGISFNYQGAVK